MLLVLLVLDGADGADGLNAISAATTTTFNGAIFGDGANAEVKDAAATKTFLSLNLVENTALTTWTGSASITTLGTVTTGTWTGSPIADAYISSAATWNAKGDALVANPLSQFAATTAAQLSGVLSDATISGDNTGDQDLIDTFGFACSDETTLLTSGEKIVFYAPYAFTITAIYASLNTAPTVQAVTADVESPAGTSLLTSVLSIGTAAFTDEETGMSKVIAKGDRISVDIDQIDTAGAAAGLKIFITHTRT